MQERFPLLRTFGKQIVHRLSAHTSVAILDALKAVALPAVEVHLSDVSAREAFRQISYAGMACVKTYMGFGFEGYRQAILYLKQYLEEANA